MSKKKTNDNHHYGQLFLIIAIFVVVILFLVTYLFLGAPSKNNFSSMRMQLASSGEYDDGLSNRKIRNNKIEIIEDKDKEEIKFIGTYAGNAGEGKNIFFEVSSENNGECKLVWSSNGFSDCYISDLNSNYNSRQDINGELIVEKGNYILSCSSEDGETEKTNEQSCAQN